MTEPTLLMAVRRGIDAPEVEPVIVHTDGQHARIELEDGEVIELDRLELRAALGDVGEAQAA